MRSAWGGEVFASLCKAGRRHPITHQSGELETPPHHAELFLVIFEALPLAAGASDGSPAPMWHSCTTACTRLVRCTCTLGHGQGGHQRQR